VSHSEEQLRFPEELLTSVKHSKFYTIENRDISDEADLQRLLLLLFNHPERSFYVFLQKHASLRCPLDQAVGRGDILVIQTDLEFFRHPHGGSDFVRISPGSESFEWEREVCSTETEYIRFTLTLSERKRREMSIEQHLAAQALKAANPLKLEPNVWGIGVDLKKLWAWFRSRRLGRRR
jgi:hypothetical protein